MRFWLVLCGVIAALCARVFLGSSGDILAYAVLFGALVVFTFEMLRDIWAGRFGVDIIAVLAMVGSLLTGQWWTGLVVVVMLSGGEWLEGYAFRRAHSELASLLADAPTHAHLKVGSSVREVGIEELLPGQIIVIKPGEVVPADGLIANGTSSVDASRLTGEPLPMDVRVHDRILAGSINQSGLLEVRVLTRATETQYSRIRTLITDAQTQKAPLVRAADRVSVWFTILTLACAALAWFISQDPVRALAVLVVATPCPLILATPIAFLSGMSRAFAHGVIVKHGGAFEVLARVRTMVFDKTGTLTLGEPRIKGVVSYSDVQEVEIIRLAASLDQGSTHVLAKALLTYAREHKITFTFPTQFEEVVGQGVKGKIGQSMYLLGRLSFLQSHGVTIPAYVEKAHTKTQYQGERAVYLAYGNRLLGAVLFGDVLRSGLRPFFARLRQRGIEHIVLLTGDRVGPARIVARTLGVKDIQAECLPEDKLKAIKRWQAEGSVVAMVGDGINDAPALAQANVGIAMSANGESVSSETADVVIVADDVTRIEDVWLVAKRTVSVAKTGMLLGMGMSGVLMGVAMFGYIQPFTGAWLQELIDVVVILQALRARR